MSTCHVVRDRGRHKIGHSVDARIQTNTPGPPYYGDECRGDDQGTPIRAREPLARRIRTAIQEASLARPTGVMLAEHRPDEEKNSPPGDAQKMPFCSESPLEPADRHQDLRS